MAALFRHISAGIYVVGVAAGGCRDVFTASSVAQASYAPLMISLAINRRHASFALLRESGMFAVSVLGQDQLEVAARCGRPGLAVPDKLGSDVWFPAHQGAPVLNTALAYFDCRVRDLCSAGDHDVILGRVVHGAILSKRTTPLQYAQTGDLDGSAALFPDDFS